MKIIILAFLFIPLIFALPASTKPVEAHIPDAVIKSARDFIISSGEEEHVDKMIDAWRKRGVFYKANISPSKLPDWVIDTAKANETYYCGTGGCETQIFSADDNGQYRLVFAAQVLDYHFTHLLSQPFDRVDVNYHGIFCGGTGGNVCPFSYQWSREKSVFGLSPDLTVFSPEHYLSLPLPSPLMSVFENNENVDLGLLPTPLRKRLLQERDHCKSKGGRLYEESNIAIPLPDLNKDGASDWAYLGLGTNCEIIVDPETDSVDYIATDSSTQENLVWLSSIQNDGTVTWSLLKAPSDREFALKIRAYKSVDLVTLDELPENKDAEYPTCDIFALANCLVLPIQLMSKQ